MIEYDNIMCIIAIIISYASGISIGYLRWGHSEKMKGINELKIYNIALIRKNQRLARSNGQLQRRPKA